AQRPVAIVFGLLVAGEVFFAVRLGIGLHGAGSPDFSRATNNGSIQSFARVLFHDYFFPFEATSVLLIVAAIAAIVMAGRSGGDDVPDPIAREQQELEATGSPPPVPRVGPA